MALYDVVLRRRIPQSSGQPLLTDIAPIKWSGLAWGREAGGPGRADIATPVDELDSAAKDALRDLESTPCEICVRRDNDCVHLGPVVAYQIQGRTLTIYSAGLLYYLSFMVQDVDYPTTTADQATHVKALVDRWQALAFGNFGIVTQYLTPTGVIRELTINKSELRHVDVVVAEMGQRDNGFDLEVTPDTRRLLMASPRKGVDRSASVILDMRAIGQPVYRQSVGAGQIASEAFATSSAAGGVNLTSAASDTTLRSTFGRVGITGSFQDVSAQATLDAHAARMLADSNQAIHEVQPELLPVAGFMVGDFDVGDLITYDYDAGLGRQTFVVRIKTLVVSLDSGTERLSLNFF